MAEVKEPSLIEHERKLTNGTSQLNTLYSTFKGTIDQLPIQDRDRAFVELNVLAQLDSLRQYTEVAEAMGTRNLQLHGIVYDAQSGEASRLLDGYETKN